MVKRVINFVLLLVTTVKCSNIEARDEKTFPNGTLVGTYEYVDGRGNQVHVEYFADGNGYSINMRGYKPPEDADATKDSNPAESKPAADTEAMDTLVPIKLEFPVIDSDTIYTIENQHNYTNDGTTKNNKQNPETNENEEQAQDYDVIYDSGFKIPKVKWFEKNKKMKKNVRKIRQTLDILMRKISN